MRKKLGCLHAHYSNIQYIENAFSSFDLDLIHFVDPALMHRVTSDSNFSEADAQRKVKEQIEWMAQCAVDAILITCTNYIAILQEDELSISLPIIKIDEPYFESLCEIQEPQIILFTNPATVEGTIERLHHYANLHEKSLELEVTVIEDTFELIMQGLKEEYNEEILKFLTQLINKEKVISVAQLSMVDAARQFESEIATAIINPLNPLVSAVVNQFELQKKMPL